MNWYYIKKNEFFIKICGIIEKTLIKGYKMKNLLLLLLLLTSLFSKTIVVDDDYPKMCEHGDCKIGLFVCMAYYDYSSIKEALNNVSDGDVIKICPGSYNESNLIVNKNILIKSTHTSSIDDVVIYDSSNAPIFKIRGWRDGVEFNYFKIKQNKNNKTAIQIQYGTNYTFENLIIESKGRGIFQNGGSYQNSTFKNVSIESRLEGIDLKSPQNVTLKDMYVVSKKGMAFDFGSPTGSVTIDRQNKNNYFKGRKIALNLGNSSQNYTIRHSKIVSIRDDGINGAKANNLDIRDVEITASKGAGIYINTINNNLYIKDLNVTDSKYENVYINTVGRLYLYDSILENGTYGLYLKNSYNGGEIENNIIKNQSVKGLKLFDTKIWRGYQVKNNCLENGNGKNVLSRDRDAYFNSNYYDDWNGNGNYIIPDIPKYDNSPRFNCHIEVNETNQTYEQCYITHFDNQAEVDENWSVIKAQNYTPAVVSQKLRLTKNSNNVATGLTLKNKVFKANQTKFKIKFKHYAYDGSSSKGADGIAIVFSDANITPVAGAYGGSLGYAQRSSPNVENGFAGGWIGIGIDEYGNYSNNNEGRVGGIGFTPQAVAIRGSYLENYLYLTGTNSLIPSISDGGSSVPSPGYTYTIEVDTTQTNKTIISVYRDIGSGDNVLINHYEYNSSNTPDYFRFSITASTGGQYNIHEIDDLEILAIDCNSTFVPPFTTNYQFDANETTRNDKNITTKIVNKSFNLNIFTNQSFSGTVCSAVVDSNENNISTWKKSSFANETYKQVNYIVKKANKNSRIKIAWLANADASCPLTTETNHTLSTDNFAIRPKEFDISAYPTSIQAGEDFNITFKALDESGIETYDYNESLNSTFTITSLETKAGCKSGTLSTNVSFVNGTNTTTATYSEIGDFNVTIEEINSSSFASVDNDDTSDSNRLISPKIVTIHSTPYKIVTNTTFDNKTISFMDIELSDGVEMNVTIDLKNKQNQNLEDFNISCYASDINLSFDTTKNSVEVFKGLYEIDGVEVNDSNFDKWDENWSVSKNSFHKGESNVTIKFGIYKNRSYPVSIVDFNITKVHGYLAGLSSQENVNKNVSFYYLNLLPTDIYDEKIDTSSLIDVIVYDKNGDHFDDERLLYWYWYDSYPYDNVDILGYTTSYKYDNNVSNFESNINKQGGEFNVTIHNTDEYNLVIIHLKTPTYLWYSRYKDYNDSLNSYCLTHHCVEYHYRKSINHKEIGSGLFKGSEVNVTTKKRKLGIKMYR